MSSGPRYHIPFPTNFLAVNTPIKKSSPSTTATTPARPVTPPEDMAPHSFLSNVPHKSQRTESMSSQSSAEPSSPAFKAADATPATQKAVHIFKPLAVNQKYSPPKGAAEVLLPGEEVPHMFLSNSPKAGRRPSA
ncbi:hypothetical protein GQ43DRAFT_442885 [Delitschia confertaspora ATCC 74209]|uniref:Uncharacterized protein n=1 Tax=Delitschia confertaspora ATCC 74209 TaxID=1513339 RepID=A0A9P4JIL9_9PLEO|nr:hypothetical protein GQ43DRAFT_442885 [Delitschia confertaspora ATCC 74209]